MTLGGRGRCHGRRVSVFSVSFEPPVRAPKATKLSEYQWVGAIPFILVHLLPLAAFYTGTRWQDWAMCVFLYWARMFGVTTYLFSQERIFHSVSDTVPKCPAIVPFASTAT